jgi:benzoate-CoA ligase family protein
MSAPPSSLVSSAVSATQIAAAFEPLSFDGSSNMFDYFLADRVREGKGSQVAVLWGEQAFTYAEVLSRSLQVARALRAHGVRRGERVLLVLPDSPTYVWALFGALALGAVVAMGNPDSPPLQHRYLIEYTRASCVITVPRVVSGLGDWQTPDSLVAIAVTTDARTGEVLDSPCLQADFSALCFDLAEATKRMSGDALVLAPPLHRDEPSMWLFTSGSTGEPKANVHSHRDFLYNTAVYARATIGFRNDDITMSISRLYFGYATGTNLFFPFAVGAKTALFSEKPTPEVLATFVRHYRPTILTNVPTMMGKLLEHDANEPVDLSSLRFCLSAGEALPGALLERWLARFGSDVYDGIGSAEMFHIYASNRPGDVRVGSLGRAVAGYELKILPEDAEGVGASACAPGEIGVLWVKGDSVSHGYWLDRDKSFKTFHGHWCRTGDLFSLDEQGYLFFHGRSDDLLKVGGIFVSPLEIEDAILAYPSVAACAVVGVRLEGLERTIAFVVLRDDKVEGEALREFLRRNIAKYKVPQRFVVVADLPKNDRGKVDRKLLRTRAETEHGQDVLKSSGLGRYGIKGAS